MHGVVLGEMKAAGEPEFAARVAPRSRFIRVQ
jgi:hypothetical protein